MKIWITGVAGFLGSHLADALIAEGHDVCGNDTLICGDEKNLSWRPDTVSREFMFNTDCRDFDGMANAFNWFKPDVVVHAAATAHEGLSNFSPSFITKNIYEASVATFSAAIASGVKRIVNMSSMSRYGTGKQYQFEMGSKGDYERGIINVGPPFYEDYHIPYPVDPYGVAKVAAEDTLRILCETHGIKYSILVPHNIIGIRQRSVDPFRNVAAIMINRCKQGLAPIIYGDGSQKRSFSPVKDCIPSIVKVVHGAADGEVINIGPDHCNITINELAEQVSILTGFKGDPIYVPGRPNEVKEAFCSSNKARRLLNYKIEQSLMDCLKEMVDYIKPEPFVYDFPLEIVTEKTPKTWVEKLI